METRLKSFKFSYRLQKRKDMDCVNAAPIKKALNTDSLSIYYIGN